MKQELCTLRCTIRINIAAMFEYNEDDKVFYSYFFKTKISLEQDEKLTEREGLIE